MTIEKYVGVVGLSVLSGCGWFETDDTNTLQTGDSVIVYQPRIENIVIEDGLYVDIDNDTKVDLYCVKSFDTGTPTDYSCLVSGRFKREQNQSFVVNIGGVFQGIYVSQNASEFTSEPVQRRFEMYQWINSQ